MPYATYPSFIYYNKDLFDEAKLPYPPTKVGDLYDGKPWDMDAVRELGMKLTVDKNGNDATSADFDPDERRPVGLRHAVGRRPPDSRGHASSAPSSFLAADGKTAQITDQFKTGLKWFNDGVWKDHFIPPAHQIQSDLLGKGNQFQSGNLAMADTHSWYTCCINPAAPAKPSFTWGVAVTPAYNGVTTAKLHADTFSILNTTKNPEQAFKALAALVASPELLTNYGAFPADPALQQRSSTPSTRTIRTRRSTGPSRRPCSATSTSPTTRPGSRTTQGPAASRPCTTSTGPPPGVDIDAELDTLKTTLQGIFDEYYARTRRASSRPGRIPARPGRDPSPPRPA